MTRVFLFVFAVLAVLTVSVKTHKLNYIWALDCESCLEENFGMKVYVFHHNQSGSFLNFPLKGEQNFIAVHLVFHWRDCEFEFIPTKYEAGDVQNMTVLPGNIL